MKPIKKTIVAVAMALIFIIGALAIIVDTDNAEAAPVYDTVTINLGQDGLNGSTITVNVHDNIIIEEGYKSWRGGWLNTYYEKFYCLGEVDEFTPSNSSNPIILSTPDIDLLSEIVGSHNIKCYTKTVDHGAVVNKSYIYRNFSFTLKVIDDLSITYRSNTDDFTYNWKDQISSGTQLTVRNVSNVVSGKDFVGWNTSTTGNGTWYQPGDKVSSGHKTLFAQWRDIITVTSAKEITLDKGGNIDYNFTFNQSDCIVKIVEKGQLTTLNLSNNKLSGIIDQEPGKYTVKFSIEKGIQKTDFFLDVYIRIYQIQPIEEIAFTGENWARNIELMPSNVAYNLIYGTITRTVDGTTETITPSVAGLNNASGTTISGTFPTAGTYIINITAIAPNNAELKPITIEIKILVEDPIPAILPPSIERTIISKTSIIDTYDFLAINPKDYLQITWNFGDGKSSSGQSVVHHYDYPGNYQWTLILKAHDGYEDTVYSGYVISLGSTEIPVDAWLGSKYAVTIEAPITATMIGPSFLSSSFITDDITGKTYMLISGTPNEDWADRTGEAFEVIVKNNSTILKSWSINLHGSSDVALTSSFYVSVKDHNVTITYLGNQNAIVYVAWDGINFIRLSGITGSYNYDDVASYVRPVMVILGNTQISDSVSFTIRDVDKTTVHIANIQDRITLIGEEISIPFTYLPSSASIQISGADWLTYSNGLISGTPDIPGTYNITVKASVESSSSTQSFTIKVIIDIPDNLIDDNDNTAILIAISLIILLLGLTIISRDIRMAALSSIISAGLIWLVIL